MVLSMFGWISMKDLRFGSGYSSAENFSSIFGIILFLFSFTFPIIFSIVILKNYKPFLNREKLEKELLHMPDPEFDTWVKTHGSLDIYLSKF